MDQQSLFNVEPQPWQLDDQDDWLAARIAFSGAPYGPYDYSIPSNLEKSVQPGVRIEVPLGRGNRKMTGYCVDVIGPFHPLADSVRPQRLKPIEKVLDPKPLLTASLLGLAGWISDYYLCPLGQVIETIRSNGRQLVPNRRPGESPTCATRQRTNGAHPAHRRDAGPCPGPPPVLTRTKDQP